MAKAKTLKPNIKNKKSESPPQKKPNTNHQKIKHQKSKRQKPKRKNQKPQLYILKLINKNPKL